jgi:acetyl-CoA carboxylase biotin carboxylase subunit
MFDTVLVANRGEIARRVFRGCRSLGLRSVAVYSEADAGWPYVKEADQALAIGPPPARESYLRIDRILEAARQSGARAIHPGYGFLAENWMFAKACEDAGLVFIGPPWQVIKTMGEKTEARRLVARAGVPVVPGGDGQVGSLEEAKAAADQIGYPVMLKAAAGGGGIGIVRAADPEELPRAFAMAQRRAQAAFGSGALYLEYYLEAPRHVEVQVAGDRHGRVVHLHERECSVQRRHQKLVEESPAPGLVPGLKDRLTAAAVAAARAAGYVNVGTVEFLVHGAGFYFLEMNTRLQVEHPVTEEVTGLDLVKCQLRIAAGEALPWAQADIIQRGAAMECRIYAEDPARQFMPSPGVISSLVLPEGEGVRVECGVAPGVEVTVHYDPLLAKLITRGETRGAAMDRMARALGEFRVDGVRTTIPFHQRVMAHNRFREGLVHTQMVDQGAFNA